MDEKKELNELSGFVHGVLFLGHLLATLYNHKKGNKKQALLHAGVCAFEVWATLQHREKPCGN